MELWLPQKRGLEGIQDAMDREVRRILLTSPTGGGKTEIMFEMVKWGFPVVFYLHRKMLLEQFAAKLTEAGYSYGVRASEHKPRLLEDIQLSSVPTDYQRCFVQNRWQLHNARIAFVDEAHDQKGAMAQAISDEHIRRGDYKVGFTATPLDLGGEYDELVIAGTNSQLRACGALLPCTTYAPNEPDAPKLKPAADGRYTESAVKHAMKRMEMFGNVFEHWRRFNPDGLPSIGFGYSLESALWHAQDFWKRGVPSGFISGEDTWINGQWYETDSAARAQLTEASRTGEVKIVWNRFVLREGIDWPWIYHAVFATIFGSLTSYLQAGGRILRNHPSLDHVIIQDHGGNWWRHGSLNSDRYWELGDTQSLVSRVREHRLRAKKDPEPIMCPKCYAVRLSGRRCDECGHVTRTRSRFVVQSDGKLKEMQGDIYKPRRLSKKPSDIRKWERTYIRCWRGNCTFSQAAALFARENFYAYPRPEWPMMPTRDEDEFRLVKNVPWSRLTAPPSQIIQNLLTNLSAAEESLF